MTSIQTTESELDTNVAPGLRHQSDSKTVLDVLTLLSERKGTILRISLGAGLVAAILTLLLPNMYRATTTIMPPQQSQSASTALLGQLAPLAALAGKDLGISDPASVYLSLLRARTLEDEIIKRFDLLARYRKKKWSDVRRELEARTQVSADRKSGVITVAVEDEDPKTAAEMANAYIQELHRLSQHLAVTEAGRRRLFFQREVEQQKSELLKAEQQLQKTQEKTGLIQLDSQAKALIENVAKLRSQIAAKEVQLRVMSSFATEQNPDYIVVQQQLSGMRAQLSRLEREDTGGNGSIGVATKNVPEAGLEYLRSLRELKYHEMLFEVLAKQFEAAKIDESKDAAIIQVIDYAVSPDKKSGPPRSVIVLLVTLVAFFGACFGIMVLERWRWLRNDPSYGSKIEILKSSLSFRRNSLS